MARRKRSEKGITPVAVIEKPIAKPGPAEREIPAEAPPETKLVFITCPLCGMERILHKSGLYGYRHRQGELKPPKGRIKFEVDLDHYPFVDFRDSGGRMEGYRGKRRGEAYTRREIAGTPVEKTSYGFPRVGGLTLQEAIESGGFEDLIDQLQRQAEAILNIIRK